MELRRAPRFAVQLPVSFSSHEGVGSGLISELSHTGCSVISEDSVRAGSTLVLHIHLPDHTAPLKVDAVVPWVDGMMFGLEFRRLSLQDKDRWACFVNAVERAASHGIRRAS